MANTKLKQSSTQSNTTSITNPNTRQKTTSSTRAKSTEDCNKCVEFAQDVCKLTDKDIITDVLTSHKSLVKLYGTALCETSCPELRQLIDTQLSECADDQFDAFLYMHERGLYPTDSAPTPKINQAKKKFSACEQQMKI